MKNGGIVGLSHYHTHTPREEDGWLEMRETERRREDKKEL